MRNKRKTLAGPNFGRTRKEKKVELRHVKGFFSWIFEILLVVVLTATFVYFFCVVVTVLGPSMEPTLENRERVLMERFIYLFTPPSANDLIVFSYGRTQNSQYFIKRVIAVPGDTVQIVNGKVLVNGEPFEERGDFPLIESAMIAQEPVKVGEDEFFVLGDNRNNSEDSRFAGVGNVKREDIRGRVWFRISPLRRFGFVR